MLSVSFSRYHTLISIHFASINSIMQSAHGQHVQFIRLHRYRLRRRCNFSHIHWLVDTQRLCQLGNILCTTAECPRPHRLRQTMLLYWHADFAPQALYVACIIRKCTQIRSKLAITKCNHWYIPSHTHIQQYPWGPLRSKYNSNMDHSIVYGS